MPHSRRTFLAAIGGAAIGAVRSSFVDASTRPARQFGVQLYTLRTEMRRDVSAVLARVAELGLRQVEFAGYFDHTPEQIAALLRRHGLTAPSAHVGFGELRGEWTRTLDVAARAGHAYVTIPWIGAEDRRTADDWKRIADLFNRRAAETRAAGLRFAYHNHDFELVRVGAAVPLELLLERTERGLVDFQLDVYWATRAGFDAADMIRRHAGRITMTHLKDSAGPPQHVMVDVGSGTIDFGRVLAAAQDTGVLYHFIEHDQPADPFASVAASFGHLSALQR